jgi:hypothetical protein
LLVGLRRLQPQGAARQQCLRLAVRVGVFLGHFVEQAVDHVLHDAEALRRGREERNDLADRRARRVIARERLHGLLTALTSLFAYLQMNRGNGTAASLPARSRRAPGRA